MGAVAAAVYIAVMLLFTPFAFYSYFVKATSGGGNRDEVVSLDGRSLLLFPHNKVSTALTT